MPDADWRRPRPGNAEDEVSLLAAQLQHEFIRRVRARLEGGSWVSLKAEGLEMSLDRLWKIARGEAAMTVWHLADLTRIVGDVVDPTP